jgi:uncharacterized linocin/CFP29 family protein
MKDILRREQAPLSDDAWNLVDQEARRVLQLYLSGRKVVDFNGPHGWQHGAVNTGRLTIPEQHCEDGVTWGTRENLPLVEIRTPFKVSQLELDDITRGNKNPDFATLDEAAIKTGTFEDILIYRGFPKAGMKGILEASGGSEISLPPEVDGYIGVVMRGVELLRGISGPYYLVLAPERYQLLLQNVKPGYPTYRIVKDIIQGEILWSRAIEGAVLLSRRGGDFELTVGQDLSIGYAFHDQKEIQLYITESLAFRVLEPQAAVIYRA